MRGRKLLYSGDISAPLGEVLKGANAVKFKGPIFQVDKNSKILVWTRKLSSPSELSLYPKGTWISRLPCATIFARKDRFAESVDASERSIGRVTPNTFEFPKELGLLLKHEGLKEGELVRGSKTALSIPLIYKPSGGSCGRGIILLNTIGQLASLESSGVIQDYIVNPLLLEGHKNDFRVYCLITSISPLVCYVHKLGLCRMATCLYSEQSCPRRDLTNYSVNKAFIDEECSPTSYKRPMDVALEQLEKSTRLRPGSLLDSIYKTILKVIICYERSVSDIFCSMKARGFLLLGMDVLFDSTGFAWVLEANTSPSFHCSTVVEKEMKMKVLEDTLRLVGYLSGTKPKGKADEVWQRRLLYESCNQGDYVRICPSSFSYAYVSALSKKPINNETHKFVLHCM